MAKKVQVLLVDDVDKSSPADETVSFSLDGVSYEIDLTSDNAARLRDDLAVWIGHARKTGGRRKRATKPETSSSTSEIRAWAVAQGLEVSSRGRVSAEVREAYERANA